jgi:glyoxylase-like metal-dependent hydrolase (beta-lactamase superfamily II)
MCGTLRVEAVEMIRPLPLEEIRRKYPVDTGGYIKLAMHGLLVENLDRVVVIDPGCADFLPRSISETYGLEIVVPLEENLSELGVAAEQVTDVIFTHLHFDHGSGAFKRVPGHIVKVFPNARYHVSKEHYEYALNPHKTEASSFFTKFFRYVDRICWLEDWNAEWISFISFYGHTHGMVMPVIFDGNTTVYYMSDLIPMGIFLDNGVYSGYDLNQELAVREKEDFLNGLSGSGRLIYFHDPLEKNHYHS